MQWDSQGKQGTGRQQDYINWSEQVGGIQKNDQLIELDHLLAGSGTEIKEKSLCKSWHEFCLYKII